LEANPEAKTTDDGVAHVLQVPGRIERFLERWIHDLQVEGRVGQPAEPEQVGKNRRESARARTARPEEG